MEKAEKLISEKTKAVIPLHFAGIPCEQKKVFDMAQKYDLRVIEDSTHAFGTTINGKKLGSYGDMAIFSFDPIKTITSIDGGCVVVNDEEEYESDDDDDIGSELSEESYIDSDKLKLKKNIKLIN